MQRVAVYIDVVFILVVLPVMALIFPVVRWLYHFPWYVLTVAFWLYGVYIVNRCITVPWLFRGMRCRMSAIVMIGVSIMITYLLTRVNLYPLRPNLHDVDVPRILPPVRQYGQMLWAWFMIVEAFSFAVGLMAEVSVQRAHRRAVEAERNKAELALYRAQIKPHFMFNTLNSIYGLFLTNNAKALTSLERFINMMRYVHTTAHQELAPLAEEVDYIRQYVELQSLRLTGMTTVNLTIDIEDDNRPIPPLLLLTFVENCFKHGVSPVERSIISIELSEKEGVLRLHTCNRNLPHQGGSHSGITNCRRRLELLYPERHTLAYRVDGNQFILNLTVNL